MATYRVDKAFPKVGTLFDIDTGESWTLWSEDMTSSGNGIIRHTLKLTGSLILDETKQKNENPKMLVNLTAATNTNVLTK